MWPRNAELKMQYHPEPPFHAGDPADGDIWKYPTLPDLIHEDRGMMRLVEVVTDKTLYTHH